MTETLIKVDLSKPPQTQEVLHNRWHPDIPMIAYVKPGDELRVECVDWTGGQIANDDVANDVRDVDLTKVHYFSGPIGVEGAEPGDLLVVDILDIGVLPESAWGFTGIFAKTNGGGFLTNHYPDARKESVVRIYSSPNLGRMSRQNRIAWERNDKSKHEPNTK